jgi:hypothetical protein
MIDFFTPRRRGMQNAIVERWCSYVELFLGFTVEVEISSVVMDRVV